MRIKLEIIMENAELTTEYRAAFLHLTKTGLTNIGKLETVYGEDVINRELSFSMKLPRPKYIKDKVELGSRVIEAEITTSNMEKFCALVNGYNSLGMAGVSFGPGNKARVTKVEIEEGVKIEGTEMLVTMQAPLSIRVYEADGSCKYSTVEEEDFKSKAETILKAQVCKALNRREVNLEITKAGQNRKVAVKHYGEYVEASLGKFLFKGDTEVLQYLYDNGIGSHKSGGFGLGVLV